LGTVRRRCFCRAYAKKVYAARGGQPDPEPEPRQDASVHRQQDPEPEEPVELDPDTALALKRRKQLRRPKHEERLDARITPRISKSDHEKAKRVAGELGISVEEFARRALRAQLNRGDPPSYLFAPGGRVTREGQRGLKRLLP
jgi:hypothetical protein